MPAADTVFEIIRVIFTCCPFNNKKSAVYKVQQEKITDKLVSMKM